MNLILCVFGGRIVGPVFPLVRRSSFMSTTRPKTAGIIIIGDEILKGQTQDTNTYFLTQNLRRLGVNVDRVSVIPDNLDVIATEVANFSSIYDFVLTSGGIGPTHDDLTFEGVAKAFGDRLEHHPKIVDVCKTWFKKTDITDPCFKLAFIPTQSQLNFGTDKITGKTTIYPLVSVKNVFIFPGIPELLRKAFNNLGDTLFSTDKQFHTGQFYFDKDELSLTPAINRLVAEFPQVTVGSYPSLSNQFYKTNISVECEEKDLLITAKNFLTLEMGQLVEFDPNPTENTYSKIENFIAANDDLGKVVRESLSVVEEAFTRYSPEEISICFNGGKDCVAMVHLVHAVHQKMFPGSRLKSFYVSESKTFPELDQFITDAVVRYNLANIEYKEPMKAAISRMLDDDQSIKATFLGVRAGDPGWERMSSFSPTDGDWPKVMRVHPILSWSYSHIWTFLRGLSIPYPVLYDRGYTSLGHPDKTIPNPALAFTDPVTGLQKYKPAYMLEDSSLERSGRL